MVRDEGKSSRKVAEWYALLILFFRWLSPLSPNGMALVGKIHKLFFLFFWPAWADLSSEDIDFDCDTGGKKSVIDP